VIKLAEMIKKEEIDFLTTVISKKYDVLKGDFFAI